MEHLELWLGTEEYGGNSSVEDLQPILSGELFPNLKYLGLRNCEFVNDIAAVIVNSPIVRRIETLDLSLGVLTDEGGRALLSLPTDGQLQHVNLHFNYMTSEVTKLLGKLLSSWICRSQVTWTMMMNGDLWQSANRSMSYPPRMHWVIGDPP